MSWEMNYKVTVMQDNEILRGGFDGLSKDLHRINEDYFAFDDDAVDLGLFTDGVAMDWSSYEVDMRELSLLHPDMIFMVETSSFDFSDFWRHFFYKGDDELVRGKLVFSKNFKDFSGKISEKI